MSCRHWPVVIKQDDEALGWGYASGRRFSLIRDCESRSYRLWCDTLNQETQGSEDSACVDISFEQLIELRDALSFVIDHHQPFIDIYADGGRHFTPPDWIGRS